MFNSPFPSNSRSFSCRALVTALCAALACIEDAAAAQDDRDGFYAGLQLGFADPTVVQSARTYVSHPTRCDELLYPPSVSPPVGDPACSDYLPRTASNAFDPGSGPAGGFMVGYATGALRFEMEYLHVSLGSAESLIGSGPNTVLQTKNPEWSTEHPPFERIGEYNINQVFANFYYDFRNRSRWTPFVGAGIGWAEAEFNYYLQILRKPEAEYLQIEFDPDWPEAAKRAAAGTASILDTYPSQDIFGYQVLAGVDYELSERTSLGFAVRKVRFDDIDHEAVATLVRSHAGVLADGVTPFKQELEFSGIGYEALTVSLKYHF